MIYLNKFIALMIANSLIVKRLLPVMLLGASLISVAQANDLSEIIKKNMEAHGGADKWQAVTSIKMSGIYSSFSDPGPFTIWRKRGNLYRFDHQLIGQKLTTCFDGEKVWWINPLYGKTEAVPIPEPDDWVTQREKHFDNVLWNYEEVGATAELLGRVDLDGQEVFDIKVMLADSTEEHWFIDVESYLAVRMRGATYDFGRRGELEMFFDDYRDVNGIMMPFLIEQEFMDRHRLFEVEEIAINVDIENSVFSMPVSEVQEPPDKTR